jgi:hypothetical protein
MTPKEAGAVQELIESPDWYKQLSDKNLAAYVRYQFLRLYSNEWDWDSVDHRRQRSHWDGGVDRFGVKHGAVWARIVRLIRELRADPGVFVCAHFSGLSYATQVVQSHSIPDVRPNNLASANSPSIYARYCEHFVRTLAPACEVAGGTIANRMRGTNSLNMSQADQLYYVLCDEGYVSASPFFRHAFADQLGCERAVERYLWHAALDYEAQQRLYDVALQKEPWCITPPLTAATRDIRKHWLEYAG